MKKKIIFITMIILILLLTVKVYATESRISEEELKESSNIENIEINRESAVMLLSDEVTVVQTWDISATEEDNVTATLYSDGKLIISGTGITKDYTHSNNLFSTLDITQVEIQEGIVDIGMNTFYGCRGLINVEIPDSVTNIGTGAFKYCQKLESINVDENNNIFSSMDGILFNKNYTTLIKYPASKTAIEYQIPVGITKIDDDAFGECRGLTSIEIPDSVTWIGDEAFDGCSGLISIEIPDSVTYIGASAFSLCRGLTNVEISTGMRWISDYMFSSCSGLTSIKIPEGVLFIGDGAFNQCSSLTSIEISNTVKNIKNDAFGFCSSLISIEIPESVTSIGSLAFHACNNLENINVAENNSRYSSIDGILFDKEYTTLIKYPASKINIGYEIPSGVTNIGTYAFEGARNLTSIEIPDSVTSIGNLAFSECNNLENINVAENNSRYSSIDGILFDKEYTTLIKYPASKINIVYEIPSGVTNIGSSAFYEAKNLTSIEIADSVTSIGDRAFGYCTGLLNIEIQEGLINIGSHAFSNCSSLTTIEIPDSVTSISGALFFQCRKLELINVYCGSFGEEYVKQNHAEKLNIIHKYEEIIINPTCTERGYTVHPCIRCDEEYVDTYTDAIGHNYSIEWTTDREATCTEAGSKSHHCTRETCNSKIDVTQIPISSHNYSEEWTIDKEATCTEAGSKSHHCTRENCDSMTDITQIPMALHNYGEWTVIEEATCEEKGLKEKVCSVCGNKQTEEISALGHSYSTEWTTDREATCTEAGEKSKHCTKEKCNSKIDVTQIPIVAHNYGEWTILKEAICTRQGLRESICSECENWNIETVQALGHNYSEEWNVDVAPTCTEVGSKSHHCTREGCNSKKDETVVEKLGHEYEIKETTDSVCEQGGKITYECNRCLDTYDEIIPAKNHVEAIQEAKEATCVESGLTEGKYCLVCNEVLVEQRLIPPTGHSYGEWTVIEGATCEEKGLKEKVCSVCGNKQTEEILALGHSYSTEWTIDKTATCTEAGEKSKHCTRENCNSKTDITQIPMVAHNYGEWTVVEEATCEEKGLKEKVCCVCEDKQTEEISALGHSYSAEWTIDKATTCTEVGEKSKHCTRCDDSRTEITTIDPLGHNFGAWVIDKEPTYEEEGHKYRICINCNTEKEEQTIPVLTREELQVETTYTVKEQDNVKFAMSTVNTNVSQILSNITANREIKVIDKTGKELGTNDLVGTGAKVVTKDDNKEIYTVVLEGDINCDGKITFDDIIRTNAIRINQSESKISKAELFAADIDDSQKIEFRDIIKINAIRINSLVSNNK